MKDPLLNLDLKNDRALARAEARSLVEPEELIRGAFEPPLLDDEDLRDFMGRGRG